MFTGIVNGVGIVRTVMPLGGDMRIVVDAARLAPGAIAAGDSVAVNGVCLTVIRNENFVLEFDVSAETLARSNLGRLFGGQEVNLELALLPTTRLGGHFVLGHVDGVGVLVSREPDARAVQMQFRVPAELMRYIAEKGSICVDGVSLTVNRLGETDFSVHVVPHTLRVTILGDYQPGRAVHIEVDVIARYLDSLLRGSRQGESSDSVTSNYLAQLGFLAPDT